MRVLSVVHCHQCGRYIEYAPSDVRERRFMTHYQITCPPPCRSILRLPQAMIPSAENPAVVSYSEAADVSVSVSESVSTRTSEATTSSSLSPADLDAERIRKAVEAKNAVQEHGGIAAAARALGVVPQTIKNRLEFLPAEVAVQGVGAEEVPPA